MSESSGCTIQVGLEVSESYQQHCLKIPLGTQMWMNSIQELYHVTYLKLNTYLKNYSSNILTYINIYEYMLEIYKI